MAEGLADILKNKSGAAVSEKELEFIRQQGLIDILKRLSGAAVSTEELARIIEMIKNNESLPPASMMKDTTTSAFGDAGRGREVP